MSNSKGYAETYKDVVHEDAVKIGGGTKAPDYAFRVGGVRKFFVETKAPHRNLKNDPDPAFQLRRYAWSAKLPLSILTDFEEFSVYDARFRPHKSDKAATARIMYLRYPSLPAESLEERLGKLWDRQWMQSHPEGVEEDRLFLARALTRVAQTLAELNKYTPPPSIDLESFVNPPATHLEALERDGFRWGLSGCATKARQAAAERFRSMERSAVVHGDVHLLNVLIRGESEVHLIDYAASGPGHPAVDLVRFELALYLGAVRQFEDEASSVAFQKALSIDRATFEVLCDGFPDFFQCHINYACTAGMTAARDAAIEVLHSHGGDIRDYLATKFLVAWQNLGIIRSQTGLARAVISATAEEIAAW